MASLENFNTKDQNRVIRLIVFSNLHFLILRINNIYEYISEILFQLLEIIKYICIDNPYRIEYLIPIQAKYPKIMI